MKFLILFFIAFNVLGQVENEVVTDEQFQKIQKERKAKKEKQPYLIRSVDLVRNAQKYAGKTFKVLVIGDTVVGFNAQNGSCGFNYLKLVDDTGFEDKTGFGQYYIESPKGIGCSRVTNIQGQDVSSITLIVKLTALADAPQNPAKTIPVLEILKVD